MLKLIWVISCSKHHLKNLQQTNKNDESRMITALIEGQNEIIFHLAITLIQ